MTKLFKLPLISFIACALTIGGIFGAWTFGGGGSADVDSNLTAGTTPNDYWQFNSVSFKFVCDNANNNPTLTGTFSDSSATKTISVHEDAGLTYEQYSEIGKPECTTDGYMFSHWAYYKEGNLTHYNLDVGFDTNVTLYAQYVPTTNPAIYLYTSEGFVLQSYMFVNPSNANEYIANNLLVSENPGTRNGDGSIKEGRDKYVVKKSGGVPSGTSDTDIVWLDDADSNDRVIKGLYNVFYSPVASVNPDWITFGSHCWFQRQYSLSLFGNPCKGWESELGINAPLGFVSETETEINDAPNEGNPYSDTKITTYKATKVVFTSEAWLGGNTDYQFKPGDRHFEDIRYPKDDISTYTNNYIEAQTSGSKNYELKDNEQRNNMFDITIEVTYKKYASNYDTAQYRNFVLCSAHIVEVVPYNYTINYYAAKEDENPIDTESVAYGSNASNFLSDELNHNQEDIDGGSIDFVTTWIDKYTGQQFDINTLKEKEITQNLNLYPLYESFDPITINYKTYNGSWVTSQTAYVYNCDPNYTNYYAANVNLTASNYDGYTYKSKWQTELTLEGTQYTPAEAGSFDYSDINSLADDGVVNVFARYEKTVTVLEIPGIPSVAPFDLTDMDDKIIFGNVVNTGERYTLSKGKSTMIGENGSVTLDEGTTNSTSISATGVFGYNLSNGAINLVNFTSKSTTTTTALSQGQIMFQPNTNWKEGNAWFAACLYVWGNATNLVKMYDSDGDGIYTCDLVANSTNVVFYRMPASCNELDENKRLAKTSMYDAQITNTSNNILFVMYNNIKNTGDLSSTGYWVNNIQSSSISGLNMYQIYDAIYLNPNIWNTAGATFFAHFYSSTSSDYADIQLLLVKNNIYICPLPKSGFNMVVFVRMPSGSTSLNWDTKWNQTGNITLPTDNRKMFTVTAWWDQTTGWGEPTI